MLNFGKKILALRDKKNKYFDSCVVRKKFLERNNKPMKFHDFKEERRN
jgi:hypothetical protein